MDGEPNEAELRARHKLERARLRRAADLLGWKLIGSETVEIRVEREFRFGLRTAIVRGRVPIDIPAEMSAEEGERALAPIIDPTVAKFQQSMERAAAKILSEPDDLQRRHVFEKSSFFSALEEARRRLVREYQDLENQRVDARVEEVLGLQFYLESFTREKRKFEYFVGPTNSGKTHAAIELLAEAESGVYLAPLRLLALEIHERMTDLGVSTSLVTGEERILLPSARHVSSTVEMVDLQRKVDVAVIDETQMLQDEQRGWAWTLAIAGVRAKRVVMCGSQDGLAAAQRLAARLGVTLEVRHFERKNPLMVVDTIPLLKLQPGDAVVAFSRNAVVELQGQIRRSGRSTASIYGSLSPVVRRREAERFRTGVAEVLVATDAIGLGLNLPIRRLIFASIEKFDGVSTRLLTPPEIRQIAGRAGRYGIHEEGHVTTLDPRSVRVLREGLRRFDAAPADLPIWISPTDEHLHRLSGIIGTTRVSQLLQFFQTRVRRAEDTDLRIADLSDMIEVAVALEMSERFLKLPLDVRCTYSRTPVTTRGNSLSILGRWGERHAAEGIVDGSDLMAGLAARDRLLLFEDRSRLATAYLWLAQRFPEVYVDGEAVTLMRERIDEEIHDALLQKGTRPKNEKHRKETPFVRRKGPPKFNPRRLKK
ncbi:MAG TPA: helicase-related protein [Candidatus Baltobacteraceae bacterium]|nr:helicase-related protein [Candidatus Baltobacteraceae bacterium]